MRRSFHRRRPIGPAAAMVRTVRRLLLTLFLGGIVWLAGLIWFAESIPRDEGTPPPTQTTDGIVS
jgi:hypothetical protein